MPKIKIKFLILFVSTGINDTCLAHSFVCGKILTNISRKTSSNVNIKTASMEKVHCKHMTCSSNVRT